MTGLGTEWVVGLDDEMCQEPSVSGTKAANLACLAQRGFRVPDGFVVTVAACNRIVATVEVDRNGGDLTEADIPEEIWSRVRAKLERLGAGPVAVRSSGLAEDLADASFAGQYETVLDVNGPPAVVHAIGRCLASATSEQVRAYRGSVAPTPMAVLVQQMVSADMAGVAFSANPVSGDREVLVSAVKGLGDRLVSGKATPEEWVARGQKVSCVRPGEGVLDETLAGEIARLATAVEAVFGPPQDIEWAAADGQVYVLQARPITALPVAPQIQVPDDGFWQKDDAHYPTPLTPFGASVYLPAITAAVGPVLEELGILLDGLDRRSLGGEVYMRAVPLGGKDRPPPPSWVMWLAARVAPPLRRRAHAAEAAITSRLSERILDSWQQEWRDSFAAELADLHRIDLTTLDDGNLTAHLELLENLLRRGQDIHFRL